MKKSVIVLLCSFACSLAFAGGFTDSKVFDTSSISSLNISLENENITISTSKDNTIHVISETNSKSVFPEVKVVENELKILSKGNLSKNDFCYISLIIPESFAADKVTVNIKNGELNIKKLTANEKEKAMKAKAEYELKHKKK